MQYILLLLRDASSVSQLSTINFRRNTTEMAPVDVLNVTRCWQRPPDQSATETSVFQLPISLLCPLVVGRKTQPALINFKYVRKQSYKSRGIPNALAIC